MHSYADSKILLALASSRNLQPGSRQQPTMLFTKDSLDKCGIFTVLLVSKGQGVVAFQALQGALASRQLMQAQVG